jgi:hypothetical protein
MLTLTPRKAVENAMRKHGKDPTVLDCDPEKPLTARPFAGVGTVVGWTNRKHEKFGSLGGNETQPFQAFVRWHHTRAAGLYSIKPGAEVLVICPKSVQLALLPSGDFKPTVQRKTIPQITKLSW